MSNRIEYIEKQITNKILEKKEVNDKFQKKESISFGAFVLSGTVALSGIIFSPSIALSFGVLTGLIVCHKYTSGKKHYRNEERLEQEITHLQRTKNNKPLATEKQYEKAKNKVIAISKSQINKEKEYDNINTLKGLMYAITVLGAAATYINPINIWIALLGIGATGITSYYELKKYNKKINLENRINNLLVDLDINAIDTKSKTKEKITKEKVMNNTNEKSKEKNIEKVYIKSRV